MGSIEPASANVEIVQAEDLAQLAVIAKVDGGEKPVDILGRLDAVLGLASDVLEVAEGATLYRVEVPDGYTLKDLVPSKKDAEAVRALVKDSGGKINGDVALKVSGVSPTQIVSVGLAAAAMVVGQAYMTEISDSLHSIDSKLDAVAAMIGGEQKARVKNAISIANDYAKLHDDYLGRPREALQAARNEIESRYNDVGEVIDWITEQLEDLEKRMIDAKAKEKDLSALLEELHSYEDQFALCLQALSALGMTRMYYDGCIDERSARIEQQRIEAKSKSFLERRQRLSGVMELRIGALKGVPVALPQGGGGLAGLVSQSPRATAKAQLLETKKEMQSELRQATYEIREHAESCTAGIDRIVSASKATRSMLTDGVNCWIVEDAFSPQ